MNFTHKLEIITDDMQLEAEVSFRNGGKAGIKIISGAIMPEQTHLAMDKAVSYLRELHHACGGINRFTLEIKP